MPGKLGERKKIGGRLGTKFSARGLKSNDIEKRIKATYRLIDRVKKGKKVDLTTILPHIKENIQSKNHDLKRSTIYLLQHIAEKGEIEKDHVTELMDPLLQNVKSRNEHISSETAELLATLAYKGVLDKSHNIEPLGETVLKNIRKREHAMLADALLREDLVKGKTAHKIISAAAKSLVCKTEDEYMDHADYAETLVKREIKKLIKNKKIFEPENQKLLESVKKSVIEGVKKNNYLASPQIVGELAGHHAVKGVAVDLIKYGVFKPKELDEILNAIINKRVDKTHHPGVYSFADVLYPILLFHPNKEYHEWADVLYFELQKGRR